MAEKPEELCRLEKFLGTNIPWGSDAAPGHSCGRASGESEPSSDISMASTGMACLIVYHKWPQQVWHV